MKLANIQYLRALAALAVVFSHSLEYVLDIDSFDIIKTGRFGVILFFVISGFIMVYISGKDRFAPLDFFRRRLTRIVPLYWTATTVVAILLIVAPWAFRKTFFSVDHYLLSLFFIPHQDSHGDISPMLSLGWTLNYEMFFYVVFALLGWLPGRKRILALSGIFVALMVAGAVFQPETPLLSTYTNIFLLPFLGGAWLGWFAVTGTLRAIPPSQALMVLALLALASTSGWLVEQEARGGFLTTAAMTGCSVAALWLAFTTDEWAPRYRPLLLLGDASYSIYLVHMYAVGFTAMVLGRLGLLPQFAFAGVGCAFVIGTASGLFSYRFVEQPFMRLAKRSRPRASSVPATKAA